MDRNKILSLLFALIIATLLLPELQRNLGIFNVPPLKGAFIAREKPVYSAAGFFSGEYQQQVEQYIEENIGFRPLLVRIRNQADFLLYRKAHAEGVIIARKGVIIEDDYINEYLGRFFIGRSHIDAKMERVKLVQDTLAGMGIKFAIVFTPSKGRFHADLIPSRYRPFDRTISNLDYFIEKCREFEINFLDLNRFFIDLKDEAPYPLYPKYGTHWSVYGMSLAADTLVRFVEQLHGQPMNHLKIGPIELSSKFRDTDFDGGESMNLLLRPRTGKMAYPRLGFTNHPERSKPMVLVVADSYYWNIYNAGIPRNLFANEAFWYYHRQVYPDYYLNQRTVDQINIQQEIEKQDIILVMITERFMHRAFWNFTDDLYSIYKPAYQRDYLYDYANSIRQDSKWFKNVYEESRHKGISLEEIIQAHAEYMFLTNFQDRIEKTRENYITYYSIGIKNDHNWFQEIKRKAVENKISVEESLRRDAIWMYEQNILGLHK